MESEGLTNIQNAIEANRAVWNIAMVIFWGGAALLSLYIKKVNKLTCLETLMAVVGLKKFKRNWKINLTHFLVVFVPLILVSYVIANHSAI